MIILSMGSLESYTMPPVSMILKTLPFHSTSSYLRSRVIPASKSTIAVRLRDKRLNKVDFPTLGRPRIDTMYFLISLLP